MTPAEWLGSADPTAMLGWLEGVSAEQMRLHNRGWFHCRTGRLSARRLRLLLCACLAVTAGADGGGYQAYIDLGERLADGRLRKEDMTFLRHARAARFHAVAEDPLAALFHVFQLHALPSDLGPSAVRSDEALCFTRLLRCAWHPAYGAFNFRPEWRTRTVRACAEDIYRRKAWAELGVLADALEDAGCGLAPLLEHLRAGGPCTLCPGHAVEDHLSPWWKVRCPRCENRWWEPVPHSRACQALALTMGAEL